MQLVSEMHRLPYINYQDNIISLINIMFIKTYNVNDTNVDAFNNDVKKGVATLCIGGGMGIAMCIER